MTATILRGADRMVSFSVLLPLRPDQIKAAMEEFGEFAARAQDGLLGVHAAASLDPPGLCLGSDDGDTEQLIEFIRCCAARLQLTGRFGFFWSHHCADMRPGGRGGGAIVLDLGTGTVLDSLRTEEWFRSRVHAPLPTSGAASFQLDVRPFTSEDSHGFELFDPDTHDVAAVVHDGMDRPRGEARGIADILAAAPVMLALLNEALAIQGRAYDRDEAVDGPDLVDQIGAWRRKVKDALGLVTEDAAS